MSTLPELFIHCGERRKLEVNIKVGLVGPAW